MFEEPLEQAIDPRPFSRSKGPSLIDSPTPAWDVDLAFCLANRTAQLNLKAWIA